MALLWNHSRLFVFLIYKYNAIAPLKVLIALRQMLKNTMIQPTITYINSYSDVTYCPEHEFPEYAFIGRSNVGKSSLINMMAGKTVAHVSNAPGKTSSINFFMVDSKWYLIDLPGYGYAKSSKKQRDAWEYMVKGYLSERANLVCTFVLIDSGIPPQAVDLEFIHWLGEKMLPFAIIFTKYDKKKYQRGGYTIEEFKRVLGETWEELPPTFISSSESSMGKEELFEYIKMINQQLLKN